MKRIILIFLFPFFVGCASWSVKHIHVNGNGTYMYDGLPITGNATIDWWSCIGISPCPYSNLEIINGTDRTDNRSTSTNTIK